MIRQGEATSLCRASADGENVLTMLAFALGLGLVGATVMVIVTIPATREGRGPWTWWARRRAERARRAAERPVPTAEERFARGITLRRLVAPLLQRLPRRRRRAPHFLTPEPDAVTAPQAVVAEAVDRPDRPRRAAKVDERRHVAQVEAHVIAQIEEQADLVNEVVVMTKKRIPMPEVIEADPIDADIVNPRILSRSR